MLRKERLVVHRKKSEFFMEEIHFLGHIGSKDGVRMDPAKIKAIQDSLKPVNLQEVHNFLGLCSYYCKFIHFLAEIVAPLHDLTRKGVVFRFGERQQQAFRLLKEKLTTVPVLILPDLKKSFQVQCDACGSGIGALLMQGGALLMQDGHVIAYESRVLRGPEQRRFMRRRLELLAMIHALQSWKHFLLGADFTVQTDHQSLHYFLAQAKLSEKHLSRASFMSMFHFQLVHIAGKKRNDSWKKELKMAGQTEEIALLKAQVAEMSAVLALPQVKDFLKTLAKGKEKGQEQGNEYDVNAHAVTKEGEPSKNHGMKIF
ncbi:hypothetical protein L7F22_017612 [Adiantum nelumboides]|nr:hypothetical protein [Adiantum nelumboides]